MNGPKAVATLMLLAIACLCFLTVPAFAIEDPWDVDGGGEGGSSEDPGPQPDSSGLALDDEFVRSDPIGSISPSDISGHMHRVSYFVTMKAIECYRIVSGVCRENFGKSGR